MLLPCTGLWGKTANDNSKSLPLKPSSFRNIAGGNAALIKKDSAYTASHLYFLENKGRVTDQNRKPRTDIQFSLATGSGLNIFIGDGAIHYQFSKTICSAGDTKDFIPDLLHMQDTSGSVNGIPYEKIKDVRYDMYRMDVELLGASKHARVITEEKQDYYENYFNENTGEHGANACACKRITYKDIYPNIDWVLYTSGGKLKHEFVVRQGGKVSDIKLKYGGTKSLKLNKDGSLVAITPMGAITEQAPQSYQENGEKVTSSYKLAGSTVSYSVGAYTGALVLDPTLAWGTYYGGEINEGFYSIKANTSGGVYALGYTKSVTGIATSGAHQATFGGGELDVILVKFSATGEREWATYYGGGGTDIGYSLAIDAEGNIFITGSTASGSGIATTGAFQVALAAATSPFLAKFSDSGALLWGTYYGGLAPVQDKGRGVATDSYGNVYMLGDVSASGLATSGAYQGALSAGSHGCILVKFNGAGDRLWATYYGGNNSETAASVAVDPFGNIYITGETSSTLGIATSGAWQTTYAGGLGFSAGDMFLAKFLSDGSLRWATYFGGNGRESGGSLATDDTGNVFITGSTNSMVGIASAEAYQGSFAGGATTGSGGDAFLAKFDSSGIQHWATYYGGNEIELGNGIAVDHGNNVFIIGFTRSLTGIATPGAFQESYGGDFSSPTFGDAFLAKFSSSGTRIWGSYYGGESNDVGFAVALDSIDNIFIAGTTSSITGIATSGTVYQPSLTGINDGFITKLYGLWPITGPVSICIGGTAALTAPPVSGTWSSNNPLVADVDMATGIVTGLSIGITIIAYTSADGIVTHVMTINATPPITGASQICEGATAALSNAIPDGTWSSSDPVIATVSPTGLVAALSMGIDTISYTNSLGCVASKVVTVHALPKPVSGATTVCVGSITTLFDSSVIGVPVADWSLIEWSSDAPFVASVTWGSTARVVGIGTGTATITFSDAHGCTASAVVTVVASPACVTPVPIVTTVAGREGLTSYSGEGGPATDAHLHLPNSVLTDNAGNLYISTNNHRILKVGTNGIIHTIAGTGTQGFDGDGGPATAALLSHPCIGAIDGAGNIYFSDVLNRRVRKIDASGIITTIAGTGASGHDGDGGPATAASFHSTGGLAMDGAGNLYIADSMYIRKIDGSGVITTIAGNGSFVWSGDGGAALDAGMLADEYLAFDGMGNLYLSCLHHHIIRKIDLSGIITTIVGNGGSGFGGDGGPAAAASVSYPSGIGIDAAGNLFFTDIALNRLRRVDPSGIINTIIGTGVPGFSGDNCLVTAVQMHNPLGLTIDHEGNVFFADAFNDRIRKITLNSPVRFVGGHSQEITTCGNSSISIDVPLSITDFNEQQPETWTLVTPPVHGTATAAYSTDFAGPVLTPVGLSYVPETDYTGPDSFKVMVSDCAGSVDSTVIHVMVVPVPGPITSTAPVCVGAPTIMTNTVSGGTWSCAATSIATISSSGIVTGVSPGIAMITYATSSVCYTISVIIVNPPPAPVMGPSTFCQGIAVTFSDLTPGGTWSSSAPATASVNAAGAVTGVSMGTATISYFSITGCYATKPATVITPSACIIDGRIITTVAGNGTFGSAGDGWYATAAQLTFPAALARDDSGNMYIGTSAATGMGDGLIRKVNAGGIIGPFAGTGTAGYSGDNGPAMLAQINCFYFATDHSGNLYFSDRNNNRIRKIDAAGIITTVAGNGTIGFTGDGGPATAAQISMPTGVAVDGAGNVYFSVNFHIRKIDLAGMISTIAADVSINPVAIDIDAEGNIYIADGGNCFIRKINTAGFISTIAGSNATPGFSGDGGPATDARLGNVTDISVDATGNIYIADAGNKRIRKIDHSGIITTVSGNGTSAYGGDHCAATAGTFDLPPGIVADATGDVYFTTRNNQRVRKISDNHAVLFTGGHSQHTSACSGMPDSINALLSITDYDQQQPETWSVATPPAHGTVHATYSTAFSGSVTTPTGLYYISDPGYAGQDSFKVLVTDCGGSIDSTVVHVSVFPQPSPITGVPSVAAGSTTVLGNDVAGGVWSSGSPMLANVDASGTVTGINDGPAIISYTGGGGCYATIIVSVTGSPVHKRVINSFPGSALLRPAFLADFRANGLFAGRDGYVYVASALNRIYTFHTGYTGPGAMFVDLVGGTGVHGFSGEGDTASHAMLGNPSHLVVDHSRKIYFTDCDNHRVRMIDGVGANNTFIKTIAGTGVPGSSGDGGPATAAQLNYPTGIARDPDGNIYVAESGRIRRINDDGSIITFAGNGSGIYSGDGGPATAAGFTSIGGIASDVAGNLYVACTGSDSRVRKITPAGIVNTVAGNGLTGFSGDGGPATDARLNLPVDVSADEVGNIYIADKGNNRVRKVDAWGIISTVIGSDAQGFSGDGCPATDAEINYPSAICTDEFGSVYFADSNNHRIRRVSDNHNAEFALGHIQHTNVIANAISVPMFSQLAVRDTDRFQPQVLTELMLPVHGTLHAAGTYTSWAGIGEDHPFRLSSGTYYIPDTGYVGDDSFRVSVANCMDEHDTTSVYIHVIPPVVENPAHIITTVVGTGATGPYTGDNIPATNFPILGAGTGITVDRYGNLYLTGVNRIFKVTPDGIVHCVAGNGTVGFSDDGTMANAASLHLWSNAIAVDNDSNIYVIDNYRLRKISNSGEISTLLFSESPYGNLAIDRNNGDLYFSPGPWVYLRKMSSSGTITTVAGNSEITSSGDGGPATDAGIRMINSIAVDAIGNVYFTTQDYLDHVGVRKVDISGIITTVVGSSSGNSGEGGPATMAQFHTPGGLAVDRSGNIYVADGFNNNIRKTDAVSGIITNVAGANVVGYGIPGYGGDGCAATTSAIHIASYNYNCNVCTDDLGNVYFVDQYNNRVRKISVNHPVSFTGGNSQSLLLNTGAAPIDLAAQLAILDSDRTQPETMSLLTAPAHGTAHVDTVMAANGGVLAPGSLWYKPAPGYAGNDTFRVVVTDCIGMSDTTTICVKVIADTSNEGRIITTIAGAAGFGLFTAGTATNTWIGHANAVETDNMNVFIASGWSMILMVSPDGAIRSIAGTSALSGYDGDGGPATAAKIGNILYMAVDSSAHKVYISDYTHHCVRMIDGGPGGAAFLDGTAIISTIAGTGIEGSAGDGGPATVATLTHPMGITLDKHGNMYVAELTHIRKISTDGIISTVAGNGSVAFSGDGGAAIAAGVAGVYGITIDSGDNMYLACPADFRVRKISQHGTITTIAGNGVPGFSGDGGPAIAAKLHAPIDVFADRSGAIYFTDQDNNRIRKVSASGIISTIAGIGPTGFFGSNFSGDGCPATAARINYPDGICMDVYGNIYIADGNNQRVRKISNNHPVRFANGHSHLLDIASVGVTIPVNDWLAVIDSEQSQLETWSVLTAPLHGTLHVDTGIASNGGLLTPGGLYYLPDAGYNGNDTFRVRVSECGGGADTTVVYVHICTPVTGDSIVCKEGSITLTHAYVGGGWSCSNAFVATVSSSGLVTGVSAGTAIISYSTGVGCIPSKVVTVNPLPAAITGPVYVCQDAAITLHSTPVGGTWSSGNTAIANAGSATGIITGTGEGVAAISYTSVAGCTIIRDVTVQAIPAAINGPSGVCSGNTITLSSATPGGVWGPVSNPVAYVGYATGIVTGVGTGVVAISYTLPTGCGVTHNVTSGFTPPAIGGTLSICQGSTTVLTNGASGGSWSSSNTAAATIGAGTGLVTAIAPGTSVISYITAANCVATAILYINALPAAITGSSSVCVGATTTLSNASTGGGTWSLSPAGIATIDNTTGLLTATNAGTVAVSYNWYNGCHATRSVTVNPQPGPISGPGAVCQSSSVAWGNASAGGTWSPALPAIATVDGSGNVSGVTPGTATITYTLPAGCYASRLITVNAVPAAITGVTSLCIGSSTTLNSGAGGTWSSSNTSVAAITAGTGLFTAISGGTATITYKFTATGCQATTVVTANIFPPPITGSSSLCLGYTATLGNIAPGGTWTTSNAGIATVDASGVVTGIALGTATISYTLAAGCAASRVVTVSAWPDNITGNKVVCEEATTNFICTTTGTGVWSSSNPSVASADSIPGVIHGVSAGTATISYSVSSACVSVTTVTVNPLPASITGTTTACMGVPTILANATPSGTWSSSNVATGTVDAAGSVTGIASGNVYISYTLATGCSRIASITIKPLPPVLSGLSHICAGKSITLTSSGAGEWSSADNGIATAGPGIGIVTGISAGTTTVSFTVYATGCTRTKEITVDAAPAPISGPSNVCAGSAIQLFNTVAGGTWMPISGAVAYADQESGLVTGVAPGAATITYTLGTGCTVTALIHALPTPAAISGPLTVCQYDTATFSSPQPGGEWSSSDVAIGTVSATTGLVTGVSAGNIILSYTNSAGCVVTKGIIIKPAPAAISGTPGICTGTSVTLSDASPGGTWSAGGAANITVGIATGIVTGISAGTALITYREAMGCRNHLVVTVDAIPPVSGILSVCVGNTTLLANTFTGGDWSSSDPLLAGIDAGGTVTGIAAGTAVITYMLPSGCFNTTVVTVHAVAPSISGTLAVCNGHNTMLTNAFPGGSWSVDAIAIATIGADGIVTGNAPGTALIMYSLPSSAGGCASSAIVTVNANPGPVSGSVTVCAASTTPLTNITPGGSWSSFNEAAATIDAFGLVTGIAAGTSVISYTSLSTGCNVQVTVTVQPVPAAITGNPVLCEGQSTALTTTSTGGTWISAFPGIATIDGSGNVAAIAAGTSLIAYTGANGCSRTITMTINALPPAISSAALCLGATNTMSNAVPGGIWQSSNSAIASIESVTGMVTGNVLGTANISYILPSGCSTGLMVTVHPLPYLTSGAPGVCEGAEIALIGDSGAGNWSSGNTAIATITATGGMLSGIAAGTAKITYANTTGCNLVFTATVNALPDAGAVTGPSLLCAGSSGLFTSTVAGGLWSSGAPGMASVGSTGTVTANAAGTAPISYVITNSCGTATAIKTVTIEPLPDAGTISGPSNMCIATTATFSDAVTGGSWSSSAPAIADISSSGVVSSLLTGVVIISYTATNGCGSATATSAIEVFPAPDAGIITGLHTVCVGSAISLSNATASGSWSSSSPAVAGIGTNGIVTGISQGTTDISYSVTNGCTTTTATYTVTVTPVLAAGTITGTTTVCAGATTVLSNTASPGGAWSSSAPAIATAGSAGTISGIAAGTARISYIVGNTCGSSLATVVVTVHPLPNAGDISGAGTVCVGAMAYLDNTTAMPGGTWASSATGIATVISAGASTARITGVTAGTAIISYTSTTACGTATVIKTVTTDPLPFAGTISGSAVVCAFNTITLTNLTGNTGGTWHSSNPSVAVAGSTGIVTGAAGGTAIISYIVTNICGTGIATHTVTVNPKPVAGIITGKSSVCEGSAIALSNTASGGVWSSGSATVAIVSGTGSVSGISAGTAVISYSVTNSCGTAVATKTITVDPLPDAGTITGITSVCNGGRTGLASSSPGGKWTSNNAAVATIDHAGKVTAKDTGVTVISYTVINNCGTATTYAVITVNPLADAGTITGPVKVHAGSSVTLGVSAPGGLWTSGSQGVATVNGSGVVTGISPGNADILYTVTGNCGDASAAWHIRVMPALLAFAVYPNPTRGSFTASTTIGGTLTIYTIESKELQQNILIEGANIIELPHGLASGIYMCRFTGDDGTEVNLKLVYEP